jgi:hypothetical protein
MDQNPLPRGSLQIRDRTGEELRTIPELPEAAVAVEAQYPAHPPGAMIVIDMLRIIRAADGADAPLLGQHRIDFGLTDAVTAPQVVLPRAAVKPLLGLDAPGVVTGLAVPAVAVAVVPAAGKISQRLRLPAVRAVSVAIGNHPSGLDLTSKRFASPLGVAPLGPDVEAFLAIAAAATGPVAVRAELLKWLPLAAIAATSPPVSVIVQTRHVRFAR